MLSRARDGGQVEIKAISSLSGTEEAQLINYLKAANLMVSHGSWREGRFRWRPSINGARHK